MAATLVKLIVTPLLVAGASLAARRWGSQVAGWLTGFPLTSAPVALILYLEHGPRFVAGAAAATLLGVLSQAAFATAYIGASARLPWPACVAAGTLAFAAGTAVFARLTLSPAAGAALVAAGLTAALLAVPRAPVRAAAAAPPAWDLPVRVLVTTAFVLLLTSLAERLGPALTGLLTPFPLYATVLAVFAHAQEGRGSGAAVMRGLLVGLYGFAAFFLVLALLVVRAGSGLAFGAATAAVLGVQTGALLLSGSARRQPSR